MPDPDNPYHEMETPLWVILGDGLDICGYQARLIRFEPGLTVTLPPKIGPVVE